MSRAQRKLAAAACALALAALLAPGRAAAEEQIAIHPDEFFVKACSGSQIGVALTTGAGSTEATASTTVCTAACRLKGSARRAPCPGRSGVSTR